MRLGCLTNGHNPLRKLQLAMMPLALRMRPNDLVRTLTYRPGLFGKPFMAIAQPLLRGRSFWTVAERERMASHISRQNQCLF